MKFTTALVHTVLMLSIVVMIFGLNAHADADAVTWSSFIPTAPSGPQRVQVRFTCPPSGCKVNDTFQIFYSSAVAEDPVLAQNVHLQFLDHYTSLYSVDSVLSPTETPGQVASDLIALPFAAQAFALIDVVAIIDQTYANLLDFGRGNLTVHFSPNDDQCSFCPETMQVDLGLTNSSFITASDQFQPRVESTDATAHEFTLSFWVPPPTTTTAGQLNFSTISITPLFPTTFNTTALTACSINSNAYQALSHVFEPSGSVSFALDVQKQGPYQPQPLHVICPELSLDAPYASNLSLSIEIKELAADATGNTITHILFVDKVEFVTSPVVYSPAVTWIDQHVVSHSINARVTYEIPIQLATSAVVPDISGYKFFFDFDWAGYDFSLSLLRTYFIARGQFETGQSTDVILADVKIIAIENNDTRISVSAQITGDIVPPTWKLDTLSNIQYLLTLSTSVQSSTRNIDAPIQTHPSVLFSDLPSGANKPTYQLAITSNSAFPLATSWSQLDLYYTNASQADTSAHILNQPMNWTFTFSSTKTVLFLQFVLNPPHAQFIIADGGFRCWLNNAQDITPSVVFPLSNVTNAPVSTLLFSQAFVVGENATLTCPGLYIAPVNDAAQPYAEDLYPRVAFSDDVGISFSILPQVVFHQPPGPQPDPEPEKKTLLADLLKVGIVAAGIVVFLALLYGLFACVRKQQAPHDDDSQSQLLQEDDFYTTIS